MRGSNKIKLKWREREKTETALDENESGFQGQETLKPDLLFTSLSPASSLILTVLHLCLRVFTACFAQWTDFSLTTIQNVSLMMFKR